MIRTSTQNDLIRYIYQETDTEENIEIQTAAILNGSLAHELRELEQTVKSITAAERVPSESTIDKILSYSKSYDLHSLK
ncbi:hypothetical protein EV198_1518 [Roseivirga ehrenbergii]|uniref:Uncharacterized protein n=1 Tax=Roseivirga ehrenbergii (strain DSM 102268 / JCM 13514 / KCTC 12282 / NCIMB 14502 / KMM 6017) TaxID=279360 RepID=A0A150XRF6_ROSEK|nr:aspartate-semialdehyde dehydrogenase [Roseivirga ehrenbergii]KYG81348.1 hypothetical protein MB14_12170 [Roseivirga ehrenbergii]TCL10488.1 hypothetical protein EV198_1518 [Roseivirga ehrenbergii]